jgi:ketosteroid isomerase-like protein
MSRATFVDVIGRNNHASEAFMSGDTGPFKALFSDRSDATLANPFGGFAIGRAEILERLDRAASYYRDGELVGVETIAQVASDDLGYTVEIETLRGFVGQGTERETIALRVTSVFRVEDGAWRLVHRHADPRVTIVKAPESILG